MREEYRPKIVYIKGIHNTIADTVLQLEYDCIATQEERYTIEVLKRTQKKL